MGLFFLSPLPVSFRIKLTKAKMVLESRCVLGERGWGFTSYLKATLLQVKTISSEKKGWCRSGQGWSLAASVMIWELQGLPHAPALCLCS